MKLGLWEPLTPKGHSAHAKRTHKNRLRRVPAWVIDAQTSYYEGYLDKYRQRPYDQTKYFNGDSFVYRVHFDAVA